MNVKVKCEVVNWCEMVSHNRATAVQLVHQLLNRSLKVDLGQERQIKSFPGSAAKTAQA